MEIFFEQYKKSEVTDTRRIINTPDEYTKNTFFYIQEAGYLKSLKPHISKRYNLDSYLFIIVISGKGTITYKNNKYKVKSQDCFLLNCMNNYEHISDEAEPWELLWIHFNGPLASNYYDYLTAKIGNLFNSKYIIDLISKVKQLIDIHELRNEDTNILSSKLITDILTLSFTGYKKNSQNNNSLSNKLSTIFDYINTHYTEAITLENISKKFYISKYYLTREFKKEYGNTITQYVLSKRITYAKVLLRFTDSSIEEIAMLCGIKDASYFNKVFKRMESMTASEYRKKW